MRAALLAALLAIAACGGAAPTGPLIEPVGTNPMVGAQWRLVDVGGGIGVGEAWRTPELVEVSDDGRTMTAFFTGGDPACYVLSDVRIERRDPLPPEVAVNYPMRLGVLGCNAALALLAVRVRLDPPLVR